MLLCFRSNLPLLVSRNDQFAFDVTVGHVIHVSPLNCFKFQKLKTIFFRDNLFSDCLHGGFIVGLTLCAFVSLVWLREQILHGGPPQWLNLDFGAGGQNNAAANNAAQQQDVSFFNF